MSIRNSSLETLTKAKLACELVDEVHKVSLEKLRAECQKDRYSTSCSDYSVLCYTIQKTKTETLKNFGLIEPEK